MHHALCSEEKVLIAGKLGVPYRTFTTWSRLVPNSEVPSFMHIPKCGSTVPMRTCYADGLSVQLLESSCCSRHLGCIQVWPVCFSCSWVPQWCRKNHLRHILLLGYPWRGNWRKRSGNWKICVEACPGRVFIWIASYKYASMVPSSHG